MNKKFCKHCDEKNYTDAIMHTKKKMYIKQYICIILLLLTVNVFANEDNKEYVAFVFTGMEKGQSSWSDNQTDYGWMIETNSSTFIKDFFSGNNTGLLKNITKQKDGIYKFTKIGINVFDEVVEIKNSKKNFDYVLRVAVKTVNNIYVSYNYEKTYYVPSEGLLDERVYKVTSFNEIETNYALTVYAYKYADLYEQCKFFGDYTDMPKGILDEYFSEKKSE